MLMSFLLLIAGFVILVKGADWLIAGASALAKRYSVSDLVIGLTIVAFGTSAPELAVNAFASFTGKQEIGMGNVTGSNIFNLFLILGVVGLISPVVVKSDTVWKEIPVSFLAIVALFLLGNDYLSPGSPVLSRIEGFVLIFFFLIFLYYVFKQPRLPEAEKLESDTAGVSFIKIALLITLGLAGLVFGGRLITDSAENIASGFNISKKFVALTIVAVGTSLPELATSVVAALKKNTDIAVGNLIGSNIFNILFILGISIIIKPLDYDPSYNKDIYLLAGGTLFLFIAMFTGRKKKLDLWEAAILVGVYILYFLYLFIQEV